MSTNRLEFVEYVGSNPDYKLSYGGYTYNFKPNPLFYGRRVEFIRKGYSLDVCAHYRDIKPYDPMNLTDAEAAFKDYVLSRKDEVVNWLIESEQLV